MIAGLGRGAAGPARAGLRAFHRMTLAAGSRSGLLLLGEQRRLNREGAKHGERHEQFLHGQILQNRDVCLSTAAPRLWFRCGLATQAVNAPNRRNSRPVPKPQAALTLREGPHPHLPGLALVWVAVMAAIPAHVIVRQSRRGRARTAIAYLAGFGAGLVMTLALGVIVASFRDDSPEVVPLGIFGAFVGPFIGMARAAWLRPTRRTSRDAGVGFKR